jgi:dihydrofolate reductase
MGATTYRVMSGFAAEGEPGTDALAGMSKVVFSTTLSEPLSWANTQLVAQDPVEAVREMKGRAAKSMRTIGSLTLCRSLLKAGLVDRFRVVVFPVITGSSGRERIYDGYPDVALDMISSRTFDGRIQLLEYVPTILAGPPGASLLNGLLLIVINAMILRYEANCALSAAGYCSYGCGHGVLAGFCSGMHGRVDASRWGASLCDRFGDMAHVPGQSGPLCRRLFLDQHV